MAGQFSFPSELLSHIKAGRNNEVKAMLIKNENLVEAIDHWGTLLHYATLYENAEIIRHLIEMGCDINSLGNEGSTALRLSVVNHCPIAARVLLKSGADVNAGRKGELNLLKQVFNNQLAPRDMIQIFFDEIMKNRIEVTEDIVDKLIALKSTLYNATCTRQILVIDELLKRGLHINSKGNFGKTALHAAAELGDLNLVKWLILKGADVNAHDVTGSGPLTMAAYHGNIDIIKLLLNRGAEPNVGSKTTGVTPLFATFLSINIEVSDDQYDKCAEYLLQNGAIPRNPTLIDLTKHHVPMNPSPQTFFDFGISRSNDKRLKILICHVAMLDNSLAESVMQCSLESCKSKMDHYLEYYRFCRDVLTTVIYGGMSLLDLLKESDERFEILVRNETFLLKIKEICSEYQLKLLYPYYYNTLNRRISRAELSVTLKELL